ncbi:MAG: hypothetical protein WBS20_06430 [Lysobacterales bacterium]
MKFSRISILILSSALLLTACNKEADEAVVAAPVNTNPLLAYVPADTAYVFADLETVPEEVTDAYVERFQPVMDVLSDQVSQFQTAYQSGEYEDNTIARLASAVLDELGGSVSKESLNKIGISLNAHQAFYAMGIFPVIRVGLGDAQALRDAIARVETKLGYQLPVKELNGTTYWRVAEDDMPVAVYIAILDQQLALSVFPVKAEDSLLAAFLGQEMPAQSMASSNTLGKLNSDKGYTAYGSGIVDFRKIADELLNPGSFTRGFLEPELNTELGSLDAVCVAELKSMIDKAPRLTAGTTSLTANRIDMAYDLEIEHSLATGLTALVSDIPPATTGDYLFSASLAIKVGKLREFVLDKATALVTSPYQCENLQKFNDQAEQIVKQLNIPMPPMINNLLGVRVMLNDLDLSQTIVKGDGLLALHVEKPEMFVGMASMMVPGFEDLDLANQTEPVRIPSEMMHVDGFDVFALMGENAIGVAVGEKNAKDLAGFMRTKSQANGTFFSLSYDMGKQMAMQEAFADQFQLDTEDDNAVVHEYADALKQAYAQALGYSRVEMRLSPDGLHIDNSLTFK